VLNIQESGRGAGRGLLSGLAACVDYQLWLRLVDHALVSAMSVPYEFFLLCRIPKLGPTVDCDCDCDCEGQVCFSHVEPILCHFYFMSIVTEI
jgi:hypothetical protein